MDALELIVLVVWAFAVSVLGGVVGLVLGNLRLPLVVLLASSPAAGAGANVAISGAAAVASAGTHARAGRVNWRLFAWMAPPSLAGGIVGGVVSGVLPDRLLLAAIGLVVLYGAVEVLRYRRPTEIERTGASQTHLTSGIEWDLFAVGTAAAVPGAYIGSKLTGRLSEEALLRAMAAILVITGLAMIAQAIL